MEILFIFLLIIINGIFSMSEIAVVSSRKSRLEGYANKGNVKAAKALKLLDNPNRFLSTVQIGITLVGIFTGIYSGENITEDFEYLIKNIPILQPYSHSIAVFLVLLIITYFTLVIGELLPKRIGLSNPEKVSMSIAIPMDALSKIAAPFIWILSASTKLLFNILRIPKNEHSVTEEEIRSILQQATTSGHIEEIEQDIVENVFYLGDRKVSSLMTQRLDLVWLDINRPLEENLQIIRSKGLKLYPVCDGDIDTVKGIILTKDLIQFLNTKEEYSLEDTLRKPIFIPDSVKAYKALEIMRGNKASFALVIDEYGGIEGLITINDIIDELLNDTDISLNDNHEIIERSDGTFLVDALVPFHEFVRHFDIDVEQDELEQYNTLAGLVLDFSHKIPETGFNFKWKNLIIEVVDLDGRRIDKLLIKPE